MTFESFVDLINSPLVHIGGTPLTFGGIGAALIIVIGSFIVSSIIQRVISNRLKGSSKFPISMIYALNRILHYLIVVLGVVTAAQTVGFNFGTLAVAFGFLGVGIGLGLQNITSNFVAGLILLIERPVAVGEFVSVEGQIGRVLSINMRATKIMTLDNILIIVPNSKFVDHAVTNWSSEDPRVRIHCKVGVAYGSDIEKVKKALLDVADTHEDVLKNPEPEARFLEFGDSSLNFDLLIWTSEPKRQFVLKSEINYMIDAEFRKVGVKIPFPQRDLHLQMSDAVDLLAAKKN